MVLRLFFCLLLLLSFTGGYCQLPESLRPGITITEICPVRDYVVRIDLDPLSGDLWYATVDGNIYRIVMPAVGQAYDTLMFGVPDHGIEYLQAMCFFDSTLYIAGNVHPYDSLTMGRVIRLKLTPAGNRICSVVAQTEPYETADYFDHLFSGLIPNLTGDTLLIGSGSRGDHGEIQTRYGRYPGLRNTPLTSVFLQVPSNGDSIVLPDDEALLAAGNRIFARGLRNTFDLAFNAEGKLFGVENSGDRDMDEELNWMRNGYHYGFPWMMGNSANPQQYPDYNPTADSLINHASRSWTLGFFSNDPSFPPPPAGTGFGRPCRNLGPDADKYRDSVSAEIIDASAAGQFVYSFTAHRSPLGIVFDRDSVLASPYRGSAFVLSWNRGNPALPDCSPLLGPFGDPGEDLLHITLLWNEGENNYDFTAERIVEGFNHPVDAVIEGNKLYVIESAGEGQAKLWRVSLPAGTDDPELYPGLLRPLVFPNPAEQSVNVTYPGQNAFSLLITDITGKIILEMDARGSSHQTIDISAWEKGMYFFYIRNSSGAFSEKLILK